MPDGTEQAAAMTVGTLNECLLGRFPAADAADWDRTGLQVGDPTAQVRRVAVALDPTVPAIRKAHALGCNVLVTHHPPFLEAPDAFVPADSPVVSPGAVVYEAASRGVALLNYHTALDFNPAGYGVMPRMLGLECAGLLEELGGSTGRNGYGAVCELPDEMLFLDFADRCHDAFEVPVQVWGDAQSPVRRIATGQGSAGSLARLCVERGIDCLVCGEMKYHQALDLSLAGVKIVQVGHDVSEQPFVGVLRDEIRAAGVPETDIECIYTKNWVVL